MLLSKNEGAYIQIYGGSSSDVVPTNGRTEFVHFKNVYNCVDSVSTNFLSIMRWVSARVQKRLSIWMIMEKRHGWWISQEICIDENSKYLSFRRQSGKISFVPKTINLANRIIEISKGRCPEWDSRNK